jgi:hypothetical protein
MRIACMLGGTLLGAVIGGVLMLNPTIHPEGIRPADAIAPFACGSLGLLFGMLLAAATKRDR